MRTTYLLTHLCSYLSISWLLISRTNHMAARISLPEKTNGRHKVMQTKLLLLPTTPMRRHIRRDSSRYRSASGIPSSGELDLRAEMQGHGAKEYSGRHEVQWASFLVLTSLALGSWPVCREVLLTRNSYWKNMLTNSGFLQNF